MHVTVVQKLRLGSCQPSETAVFFLYPAFLDVCDEP
jgi:hypothetical protein